MSKSSHKKFTDKLETMYKQTKVVCKIQIHFNSEY